MRAQEEEARGTPPAGHAPRPSGATLLVLLMALAVGLVALLALWDHRRESEAALDDFAQDQATLAGAVSTELGTRLTMATMATMAAMARREGASRVLPAELLEEAARVERPGAARVLLRDPSDGQLHGSDGAVVESPPLQRALAEGRQSAWLSRPEAAALGLPLRRAAAGIGRVDGGPLGQWAVFVVTTAVRVRDREQRATGRLVLGVTLAAGLVFAFGTAALFRQRRGLILERELALAALGRDRDAELATASRAATLGTLAMGIAHEVATPLGIISGRAEQLLARAGDDERAGRSARAILDQTERIRLVIRAFLDIVRGGAPALGDTPPAAVLEGALGLVHHRFDAASVSLSSEVEEGLPLVHGDVPLLQQALVNLLLNACDACPRGGHVRASLGRDGDHVVFTVTDDGRGITAEVAARATEPFFTTKAPGAGSGLGLAIASEIVKLHRGRLTLTPAEAVDDGGPPKPRCGTRATISLPLPEARAHVAA
jgi:signal transduction histidine kinase